MEPEDEVIALADGLLGPAGLDVEFRELICPFFCIFLAQVFLEDIDLLVDRGPSAAVDLVLQDVTVVVMRRRLHILRIIFDRLVKLFQLDRDLDQTVEDRAAERRPAVCALQEDLRIFVSLNRLIDFADHHKRLNVAHPLPVDRISHLRRIAVILLRDQVFYLLEFFIVFILIHFLFPRLRVCTLTGIEATSSPRCLSGAETGTAVRR